MDMEQALPTAEAIDAAGGVVGYLLLFVVSAGGVAGGWFLRRMATAMDRMAAAQEAGPPVLAEIKVLLGSRLDILEEKIDKTISLADEHVSIARLWKATEAADRTVRKGPVP